MTLEEIKIDPEQYYSASYIISNRLFPWIKSVKGFTDMLRTEKGAEMYKPVVRTATVNTRYKIKGSTIIEIRRMAEAGELKI